jgi:hypothetical protein
LHSIAQHCTAVKIKVFKYKKLILRRIIKYY